MRLENHNDFSQLTRKLRIKLHMGERKASSLRLIRGDTGVECQAVVNEQKPDLSHSFVFC